MEIINGNALEVLKDFDKRFSLILTSPPYNTSQRAVNAKSLEHHVTRYDIPIDNKTADEYAKWCVDVFNLFDKVLEKNGVVLWNASYSSAGAHSVDREGINSLWFSLSNILKNTNFMIADKITWKKRNALPNNSSKNKLTRICEDVFVFCRKDEYLTFNANKPVSSIGTNGQTFYKCIYNFIEAPNNDGKNPLNKATFSKELVTKLLDIYYVGGGMVLDPFMGTGTTLCACKQLNIDAIGIELSEKQCIFAKERLVNEL